MRFPFYYAGRKSPPLSLEDRERLLSNRPVLEDETPLKFGTMNEAFDYCRQKDRPIKCFVRIKNTIILEQWQIFPSGKAVKI